jgi:hypothetical protein
MRKWIILVALFACVSVSGQNTSVKGRSRITEKEMGKMVPSLTQQQEQAIIPAIRKQTGGMRGYAAPAQAVAEGNARVILTAGDIWGDGTGYQLLLDADATALGSIFYSVGHFNSTANDVPASLYAQFEYKIPVNADGALATSNIVMNNSIGIDIPAGTYDYAITNPTPGTMMYIANAGRADDYVFEAGKIYEFTLTLDGQSDWTTLAVLSGAIPAAPSGFTVAPDAGGALSAVINWTNPLLTAMGNATLSSLASVVIKRDGITVHTINNPVPGANGTWTDNTAANGTHSYTIYATNSEGKGLNAYQTVFVGVDPCSIPASLPYMEEFTANSDLLGCWNVYDKDGTEPNWGFATSYSHSGYLSFFHGWGWTVEQDGWLLSPKIALPETGNYYLSFWSFN